MIGDSRERTDIVGAKYVQSDWKISNRTLSNIDVSGSQLERGSENRNDRSTHDIRSDSLFESTVTIILLVWRLLLVSLPRYIRESSLGEILFFVVLGAIYIIILTAAWLVWPNVSEYSLVWWIFFIIALTGLPLYVFVLVAFGSLYLAYYAVLWMVEYFSQNPY